MIWFAAILFSGSLYSLSAYAQTDRIACPDLVDSAPAEEHAVCWFLRDSNGSPECVARQGEANPCIAQTNAWCADAPFDIDSVTSICFFAAVRAGHLGEAKKIYRYLESPSKFKTAITCDAALKRADVKVLTNPKGAEVVVDDRSYGSAPVDITLLGNWWESHIKARFASDSEPIEVEVTSDQLLDAFDKRDCVFGDLIIQGPPTPKPLVVFESAPPSKKLDIEPEDDRPEWLFWTSITLAGVAVASGVAASILYLVSESEKEDFKEYCGSPDTKCWEGEIDTSWLETKITLGNILAAVGSVCLAASIGGGVLYFSETDDSKGETDIRVSVGPAGLKLKSRF